MTKYSNSLVWSYYVDLFDYFILAVIIDKKYFCLHAGISPQLPFINDFNKLDRF